MMSILFLLYNECTINQNLLEDMIIILSSEGEYFFVLLSTLVMRIALKKFKLRIIRALMRKVCTDE
jgi:hypothetical protein